MVINFENMYVSVCAGGVRTEVVGAASAGKMSVSAALYYLVLAESADESRWRRRGRGERSETCFVADVFWHCNYAMTRNSVMSSFPSKSLLLNG